MKENSISGDNRFEIIEKAKEKLLNATNIEDSKEEMKVLTNILFRMWQAGLINEEKLEINKLQKENSIEEDIKILEEMIENANIENMDMNDCFGGEHIEAIEHILSDYKRVLKENEELNYKLHSKKIALEIYNRYIPKSKLNDIIDRIDYDIKKTKEIISKNTNIYASYRKNDYQIVRLRAMNTKSLDIKKRLQKLLESEE